VSLLGEKGIVTDGDTVRGVLRRAAIYRPRWSQDLSDRLVETFELPPKKVVAKLSRGQRSALGITVAMAGRTSLTLLDEAYLGMDAPSRYAFYDALLEDYMEHPRTFIVSTHHIDEVAPLFESVVIIDRGRLVAHDDTDALRTRGIAVTGPADVVGRFTDGMTVLSEQRLGPTVSVTVLGSLDERQRSDGSAAGLEFSPVTLQDLFVHMTAGGAR
jgi:ABC-2 type transport system ATP-binding protein